MKAPLIGLLLAMAMAFGVHAQASPPDAAALAKARELMTVMDTGNLIVKSLDAQTGAMTKGLADRILQSGMAPKELADDPEFRAIMQRYLDRISGEVSQKVKTLAPQIVDQTTVIYARNFSAQQLEDVIVFYRTPTGRAFLAKMPALSAESAEVARDLTMGPMIDVMKAEMPQMTAELKAWTDKKSKANGGGK